MSKKSDDYEQFVAELIGNLQASHRNICDIGFGKTNNVLGKSGQEHQIDVSFVDRDFARPTLILVECKRYANARPINLEHVKVVLATQLDILVKVQEYLDVVAIIISTNGERKGVRRFAEHYGITLDVTEHRDNYSFRYEKLVQAGLSEAMQCSDFVTTTTSRICSKCKKKFEPD